MNLLGWEIWSYAQVPLVWLAFRRWAGRDVSGELLAGALFGAYIEFSTEPLWNYHFRLTVYKDIPLSVPLGWGVMFAQSCALSEFLYRRLLGAAPAHDDPRLLLCDAAAGVLVGVPLEAIGHAAGIWDYNFGVLGWTWGRMPLTGLPYEALAGYAMLMLVAPSFVRRWRDGLAATRWAAA